MKLLLLLVCLLAVSALPKKGRRGPPDWHEFAEKVQTDKALLKSWEESVRIHSADAKPLNVPFNCQIETSPTRPTSVHQLRPSDIDVVIGMGDSITAGMGVGAETILELPLQNRGRVWCCGGDETWEGGVQTLANLLKKFNPNLKGPSTGDDTSVDEPESWMNRAVPGARSEHMPEQADDIIQQLRTDQRINMNDDWKLINLFIGGNDLCWYCDDEVYRSPQNFVGRIREALDKLKASVPRALVQIMPIFDITPLPTLSTGIICDGVHELSCGCTTDEEQAPKLRPTQLEYFRLTEELINSDRYDTSDNFTVVLQTMTRDATPPKLPGTDQPDHSFWSPDCFHPSEKGHQSAAIAVWNTMLIPVGQKPYNVTLDFVEQIRCPTQSQPYIFTRKNSNPGFVARPLKAENIEIPLPEKPKGPMSPAHGTIIGVGVIAGVVVVMAVVVALVMAAIRVRQYEASSKRASKKGVSNPVALETIAEEK